MASTVSTSMDLAGAQPSSMPSSGSVAADHVGQPTALRRPGDDLSKPMPGQRAGTADHSGTINVAAVSGSKKARSPLDRLKKM
ncbi:hypothetical protein CAOG_009630 [Capsaspora owczarzaki ATCC 30864]|uniref:Uncharacterized protein n=1 Tax=Capsaspora owczarzaki (strain ATCC 30864) TaxID=595528 RepID=A0A0D2WMK6_CAPO3|nr:hypothetical protein CAOG_009630 [Capsaspora owczarzaki ATCC 30864]